MDDNDQKLISAACAGDIPALKYLLWKTSDEAKQKALIEAARLGKIEAVKILLHVLDVSAKPSANQALIFAVEMAGHHEKWLEIVEALLNWGADPNDVRIVRNITPLMMAVDHGNIRLVKMLLENCADISAQDADGRTALDWAEKNISAAISRGDRSERETYKKIKELLEENICILKAPTMHIPTDLPKEIRSDIERLYSPNPTERIFAIGIFKKMGSTAAPAVPFLVEILCGRDEIAKAASDALAEIGSPAVELLINALNDKRSCVRGNAAEALKKIDDPRIEDALIKALKDRNSFVRWAASIYFSHKASTRAIPILIEALKDEYTHVRSSAVSALESLKDPRAVKPLIALLKEDYDIHLLDWAVQALYQIKTNDQNTIAMLIQALKEKNSWVRRGAMAAIHNINDPRIVDPLIEALRDKDSVVRDQAIRKLGNMKDPRAIEPLIQLLEKTSEYDRYVIVEALDSITGEKFGEDPIKWRSWWEQKKRDAGKGKT